MLLLSALSEGTTLVENLLDSADIRYMLEALKQLKVSHISRICIIIHFGCCYLIYIKIGLTEDKEKKVAVVVGNAGPISSEKEEIFLGLLKLI